ncbi:MULTISPECIES: amino acid deaminase [unclassified Streptomyces]|uniref:amino acid deaminase n=1 Tax=unclassified Streptomyces TaxID=2593676 RepID=UPI00381B0DEF
MSATSMFERLSEERIGHGFLGLLPDSEGMTVGELITERRNLFTGGFTTPILALSAESIDRDLVLMEQYSTTHDLNFAPYGKVCASSQILHRQRAKGAWGITAATPHQVRAYRAFGIQRVFLASELIDAAMLGWLARELAADVDFRFVAFVDSVRGVELMDAALHKAGAPRPVEVVIELGAGKGAGTGVRTADQCMMIADAVASVPTLRLVGIAGHEGEVPGADYTKVTTWLQQLIKIATDLDKAGRFTDTKEIIVSVAADTWFHAVTAAFAQIPPLSRPLLKLARTGTPVSQGSQQNPFDDHFDKSVPNTGLRLWTQVVSLPEPGQAFINTGKIDTIQDLNLSSVQVVRHTDGETHLAAGVTLARVCEHHAQLKLTDAADLEVGDWIGLSLPYTSTPYETWPLIPLVQADGTIIDCIRSLR